MKTFYKRLFISLVAIIIAFTAVSCSSGKTSGNKELKIVCTIFPIYDWVHEILGESASDADLTMLLDNGVDLHSYQPTADDLVKIASCDMFIYVGGESDKWVSDALAGATNKDMVVINLLDVLGDKVMEEKVIEGMQSEEDKTDSEGSDEGPEYDEHVWLSLKNAEILCSYIAEKLDNINPDGKSVYDANLSGYTDKLKKLDGEYADAVGSAKRDTLLFADRFPFRYLVDDYGLNYYAAFVGCSAETEASFETIAFLAAKVDELGLTSVMTIEGSDHKIAQTVIENTKNKDQQILTLNSLQSVTSADIEAGETYLAIMQSNLETLKIALN
jgi:ABC-type metal ion transport system, periplasmic component/surface adhesin